MDSTGFGVVAPRSAPGHDDWDQALTQAELAVEALWQTVRATRRSDYQLENRLWTANEGRLRALKRKVDAVVI